MGGASDELRARALQMSLFRVLVGERSDEERMEDAIKPRAFTASWESEDEDALIAEAARTDASAFAVLYERYYPRVYRYVYHRVGSATDAEDIAALVFMKTLEGLSGYQARGSGFAPWLFRITRNAVVDHYRKTRTHAALDGLEHHTAHGDPVSHVLTNESAEELRRLVYHLSTDQREVVLLRYAADLSFAEIAATLKKNEPAVRMLLHRGLRKLKTVMNDG